MRKGPRPLIRAATAALACAAVAAGCGLGPGDETGRAQLTITRDYGSEPIARDDHDLRESDDVLALLDRSTELETRYGGGFVQSIDGLSGEVRDGRSVDWFFYVNGVESPIGSADYEPGDGDRIWWDHHDWTSVMRVPAVVGSFPEPFVNGFMGERWVPTVTCLAEAFGLCGDAESRLREEGVPLATTGSGSGATEGDQPDAEILVGTWAELAEHPQGSLAGEAPDESGVFARFGGPSGSPRLELFGRDAEVARTLGAGAGLIAAVRPDEGPATWLVTGTDDPGVEAAIRRLGEEELEGSFALAVPASGEPIGVPVP